MIKQNFIQRVRACVVRDTHKHTTHNKQILKRTSVGIAVLGFLMFGASTTFILTQESTPYTSELAFTERSENSGVMGTVIPASCESDIPQNHFVGDCQCSITASACLAYAPGYCLKHLSASATFGDPFWASPMYFSNGGWLSSWTLGFSHPLTASYPTISGGLDAWIPLSGADLYVIRGFDALSLCTTMVYGEVPVCAANTGASCASSANACGQVNWSTIQCDGSCPATIPANPPSLGASCASPANACGQVNWGSIQCNGACSVGAPANPPSLGASCTSAPNICGQTNTGTIQCNGACSVTTPPDASCPVCTGTFPANASLYPGDHIGFLSVTNYVYRVPNTAAKCEYACDYGYTWNGTSCDAVDIYATNASPAATFVQEIGNNIPFNGSATNGSAITVSEGGWAGVEVDWGSDGSATYYAANGGAQLDSFVPNQSKALSYTETNAPAGIHQYRFNVDSTNALAESNEANNRSSWTSFRVISGNLTASNVPTHGPGTITLDWNTQGTIPASNCAVKEGSNTWNGMSGSQPVSLTSHGTYTYVLTCDGTELDRVLVTIDLSPDLSVDKRMVEQGTSATLTWRLYTQVGCTLTGGGLNQTVSIDDSKPVMVDGRTTYILTCPIGSDNVMVEVVPRGYES